MFICEIWLLDWYFPQFCTSDMSKYGYLAVFQKFRGSLKLRDNESRLYSIQSVIHSTLFLWYGKNESPNFLGPGLSLGTSPFLTR